MLERTSATTTLDTYANLFENDPDDDKTRY